MAQTYGAVRGLSRFEGFTDAVFAIALTLLIVEIRPPGSQDGPSTHDGVFAAVLGQWREFLAFLLCFFAIGVYWLQHHFTGRIYAKSDHVFGLINLAFLFGITTLPYPLRIWCFSVGTADEAQASVIMTAGMLLPGALWLGKWIYAVPTRRIVDERLDTGYLHGLTMRYAGTVTAQALAVPLAFFSPRSGVALTFSIAAFYLLPPPTPRYRPGQEPEEEEKTSA